MQLSLTHPLAFFDLETTGVTIGQDRIIEISVLKILPGGEKTNFTHRINPEIPIPEFVTNLTGITNEDVKDAPTFSNIAVELNIFLEGCDLAGYNSNKFDVPFLYEEFGRVGVKFSMIGRRMIDVQNIFHKMEPRTLSAAYKFYCTKDLINAHSADADTIATFEIFEAQLKRYSELEGKSIDELHKFTNMHNTVDLAGRLIFNEKNEEIVNFGKHKGKKIADVFKSEPSYYDWIMKGDFSRETKSVFETLWKKFNEQRLMDLKGKFNAK